MKRISTPLISVILVLVVGSLALKTDAHASKTMSLTLNPVETQSSNDTVDMTSPGEVLHVDKQPVLKRSDFSHAEVSERNGRSILRVTLSDTGATKFKDFSRTHVGQKLAVLADNHVIQAPKIRVPISGHAFEVDAFSKAEADQLASMINQ